MFRHTPPNAMASASIRRSESRRTERTSSPVRRGRRLAGLTFSLSLVISTLAIAGLGGTAGAADSPQAIVTLLPATVAVGQNATVAVSKSVLPKGDSAKKLTLTWGDGSKTVTLAGLGARATHQYVAPGHYAVTVKLTDAHGKTVSGSAIQVVQARSGSYSGSYSANGYGITLYVSGSQTEVQDISIPVDYLESAGTTFAPDAPVVLDSVALAANGSFSSTSTQTGVVGSDNYPATFTITFAGRFQGFSNGAPEAAGSVLETAKYTDGTTYSCTSNKQSWSVTRNAQPTQPTTLPPVGSYSGAYSANGYGITLYVSRTQTQLQDISIPVDYLECAGTTFAPDAPVVLDSVALAANGSFSSTSTQTGVVGSDNYPTTFTITFQGHFHGVNASGAARAAGSVLETATYTNGTTFSCTSNKQSWSITRGSQPTQPTTLPPAGSYSGSYSGNGYGISLYVSGSRTQLQDISIPVDYLESADTTFAPDAPVVLDSVALAADGSFSSTSTQTGVVGSDNYPTTFTITFQGHFHGVNASGAARAAGSVLETATYTNGTTNSCTSNKQSWSVAWDTQPTQPTTLPPVGTYSGSYSANGYGITLNVGSQTQLQDISIPVDYLYCDGTTLSSDAPVVLDSVALAADGSFSSTSTQTGVVGPDNYPATFTITFEGHFHGVNASGAARAAGSVLETATYTNGTTNSCTSNKQSWSVAWTGS